MKAPARAGRAWPAMLAPVLTRRSLAIALALLLLLTQHLGLQHLLGHALQGGQASGVFALAAPAGGAVAGDVAQAVGGGAAAARATDSTTDSAATSPADGAGDEAADGLCRICLLLATLGVATLPALLQWQAQLRGQALRVATRLRQWAAPALVGYQARAPPRFLPT